MAEKDVVIGIDLGTTNSVCAFHDGKNVKYIYYQGTQGNRVLIPSYVSDPEGEDFVGEDAKDNLGADPDKTVYSFKRLMGRPYTHKDVQHLVKNDLVSYQIVVPKEGTEENVAVRIDNKEYSPVYFSKRLLAHIKKTAEDFLETTVSAAVITVPAYFTDRQRSATIKAATEAGLTVLNLISEPTAAAKAARLENYEDFSALNILVFDFGGGTFDISHLILASEVFNEMNHFGDSFLGGDDLDHELIRYLSKDISEKFNINVDNNKDLLARLKKEAENVKIHFSEMIKSKYPDHSTLDEKVFESEDIKIQIIFPSGVIKNNEGKPQKYEKTITFKLYNDLIKENVDRSIELLDEFVTKFLDSSDIDVQKKKETIDIMLLAGNTTRVPAVNYAVRKYFAECSTTIIEPRDPKFIVAEGAALEAQELITHSKIVCPACGLENEYYKDYCENEKCEAKLPKGDVGGGVLNMNYGLQTFGDKFAIVFPKGTRIPTDPRTVTKYQSQTGLRFVVYPIFAGEELVRASKNELQSLMIGFLPPNVARNTAMEIELKIDSNTSVSIDATLDDDEPIPVHKIQEAIEHKALDVFLSVSEFLNSEQLSHLQQNDKEKYDEILAKYEEIWSHMVEKDWKAAIQSGEQMLAEVDEMKIEFEEAEETGSDKPSLPPCPACGSTNFDDELTCKDCGFSMFTLMLIQLLMRIKERYFSLICENCQKKIDELLHSGKKLSKDDIKFLHHETEVWSYINLEIIINGEIRPKNFDEANTLEDELNTIIDSRTKNEKTYEQVRPDIDALIKKIEETLQKLASKEKTTDKAGADAAVKKACPSCGKMTITDITIRCKNCGFFFRGVTTQEKTLDKSVTDFTEL